MLLLCVWYKYSKEEALQKGFKSEKLTNNGIWSDRILEIKVLPDNAYEIVWEWDFWDHAIQDIRPDLPGYGTVSDHPELLDVNFFEDPGANPAEWIHVNSLDYNAALDQILISSKFHNEIYIIDHSTTREEAKGHTGGRYGKGGDFLYRWGNPRSYGRGTRDHHWLFGQHDAQWIADSLPGAGNLLLFNNGSNRPGELYSTIDEIVPPDNGTGTYPIDPGLRFQPELPVWMFTSAPRSSFYSARISGVQRLPNGNTLACEGNAGRFVEVNEDGEIVWLYRNPVNQSGPLEQGKMPSNVDVFRIDRYPENYAAFVGRNLSSTGPIEVDASGYDCSKLSQSLQQTMEDVTLVTPNPASHWIQCQFDGEISIFTLRGEKIMETPVAKNALVDISHLSASMYMIRCCPHGVATPIHINMIKF
jgi:hypothetical protein